VVCDMWKRETRKRTFIKSPGRIAARKDRRSRERFAISSPGFGDEGAGEIRSPESRHEKKA